MPRKTDDDDGLIVTLSQMTWEEFWLLMGCMLIAVIIFFVTGAW